jgi:esterase/lipase
MKEKNPGVIFFHGLTSNENGYIPFAEKLAEHGIVGLTLSVRGHGESEGDFSILTVNDVIQDGLNAYDFFSKYDFIDPDRIGLLGKSVGGAIVSCVSAQRKVKVIIKNSLHVLSFGSGCICTRERNKSFCKITLLLYSWC